MKKSRKNQIPVAPFFFHPRKADKNRFRLLYQLPFATPFPVKPAVTCAKATTDYQYMYTHTTCTLAKRQNFETINLFQ